eukprot:jgi/Psemu1/310072/fgenesh1_kg.588_\
MTSKLISLARILQSKTAVASRAAPAALADPLRKLFGTRATSEDEDPEEDANANANGDANQRGPDEPQAPRGLHSAVIMANASAPVAARVGPIASPAAREELRESIRDYYHRATAKGREASAANDRILEHPDLSIPFGDRALCVAQ